MAITEEMLSQLSRPREWPSKWPGRRRTPSRGGGGWVVGVQTVTAWREGMTRVDLPPVYRGIVDGVDDAPGAVQAKQIVPKIGLPAQTSKIEAMWSKLKRLVERGWPAEQTPGQFTVSAHRAAADSVR
ncbi:hypothetical protein T261_0874 [Streptomyces lydicus]|nr:hypothetical protein T261_0874 [Streptomyces lydicus]